MENHNTNQVGKGRVVFQHPHECCATPTLGKSKWKMGNCLSQFLPNKTHPIAPTMRSNVHVTAGSLTKPVSVPVTVDHEAHSRLVPAWTRLSLNFCHH